MPLKPAKDMSNRFGKSLSQSDYTMPEPTPVKKKKGRPPKKEIEDEIYERDKEIIRKKEKGKTDPLLNFLFDKNKQIPLEEIIKENLENVSDNEMATKKKGGRTTARARSALTSTKEMLEDITSIEHLEDYLEQIRKRKEQKKEEEDENSEDDLSVLLPLLQQQQQKQQQSTQEAVMPQQQQQANLFKNIDPTQLILLQALSGGKQKSSSNMLMPLLLMQTMATQQQPAQANNPLNTEMMKMMFKMIMDQQQQQQPAMGVDPTTLALLKMFNNDSSKNNNQNTYVEKMLMKFEQMMAQSRDDKLQMILQQNSDKYADAIGLIAEAMKSSPKKELMENFSFFNQIAGDRRSKDKDELEYDLKKYEMNLHEQARRDVMNREEREKEREEMKNERFFEGINKVADKLLPEGGIVDLIGSLGSKKKNREKTTENELEDLFDDSGVDLSELDNL